MILFVFSELDKQQSPYNLLLPNKGDYKIRIDHIAFVKLGRDLIAGSGYSSKRMVGNAQSTANGLTISVL